MSSIPPRSSRPQSRPYGLATPSPASSPSPPGDREQRVTRNAGEHHAALLQNKLERVAEGLKKPARYTTYDLFRKSAARNMNALPSHAELETAGGLLNQLLHERHTTFMQAMAPRTVEEATAMLRAFLNFPDTTDLATAADAAVSKIGGDKFANEIRAFGDKQRAEAAFVKRTNVWTPDKPLSLLLAPSRLTDSTHPEVKRQARGILQGAHVMSVLTQKHADGTHGEPAEIAGIDGTLYTAETLAKHPRFGLLLKREHLWETLQSKAMRQLLANPEAAIKKFPAATLDRLAMAQRIAAVTIHYTVRDSIKYGLGGWRQAASQVMRLRQGSCSGSANVATALARAANLPAGVVITWVELPHYFYAIMTPNVLPTRERTSVHADTAYVMLDKDIQTGRYAMASVRGDASDEAQLAANVVHDNHPTTHVVHFTGGQDKLLGFRDPFVYDVAGPIANVDPMLDKSSSALPPAEQRWQFLNYMGRHVKQDPNARVADVATQFAADAEQYVISSYEEVATAFGDDIAAYHGAVKDSMADAAVADVFKDKPRAVLQAFLSSEEGAQHVATVPFDADGFHAALEAFAATRGVAQGYMPTQDVAAKAYAAVTAHVQPVLEAADEALVESFGQAVEFCNKYGLAKAFGDTAEARVAAFGQLHARTYRFMIECYPTERALGAGPDEMKRYLDQSTQTDYVTWLQTLAANHHAMPDMFKDAGDAALAYLVKDDVRNFFKADTLSFTRPTEEVRTLAGINDARLNKIADFHAHLLSNISAEVMNRCLEFGRDQGEGIRVSLDSAEMFEQWMTSHYPALAQFHREELQVNPDYPYALAMYAFMRLPMNLPGPAEQTLARFVQHVEAFDAPPFTDEDDLDRMFADFLKGVRRDGTTDLRAAAALPAPEHTPIDAFKTHAQGGGAKPFGVLYALVKAYILLPKSQRMGAIARLVQAGEANAGTQRQRIDRFI